MNKLEKSLTFDEIRKKKETMYFYEKVFYTPL